MSTKFDIQTLTLGETAWAENYAGMPLSALSDESRPSTELLIGLARVIKRRTDPEYTVEQATNLTMAEISELLGGDEDETDDTAKN